MPQKLPRRSDYYTNRKSLPQAAGSSSGEARETSSPKAIDDKNNKRIPNCNETAKLKDRWNAAAIPKFRNSTNQSVEATMRIVDLPICACFEAEGITSKGSKQSVQIQNVEMKMGENIWGK